MQLNLSREHAVAAQIEPGMRIELHLPLERYYAIAARTFGDARAGELILYEDSYGTSRSRSRAAMRRGCCRPSRATRCGSQPRPADLAGLHCPPQGEVAQLVEHTAENRGVAG